MKENPFLEVFGKDAKTILESRSYVSSNDDEAWQDHYDNISSNAKEVADTYVNYLG